MMRMRLVVFLLVLWVATVSGQTCPMTVWAFTAIGLCQNRALPEAAGTLYADGLCHTIETQTPDTDPNYDLLPGTYTAQCTPEGQLRFSGSGCSTLSCRSSSGREVCDFDITSPSALYGRKDPPEYEVQNPSQANTQTGFYKCFALSDPNQNFNVSFVIFGDCNDTACQPPQPTPAPVEATEPPTTQPTEQPTEQPTLVPIASTSSPSASPTVMPTASPTASPSQQPSIITPTLAPVTPPPTRDGETRAPSQLPSQAPSPSPVVSQPTLSPTTTEDKSPPEGAQNVMVPVVMWLSDMSSTLEDEAFGQWNSVTLSHIRQTAPLGIQITKVNLQDVEQVQKRRLLLRRYLEEEKPEPNVLQISFIVDMTFTVVDNTITTTAADLVGGAFNSEEERTRYLLRLGNNEGAFENVKSVRVEVEGTTPPEDDNGGSNAMPIIIGAAVGGIAVLAVIAYFVVRRNSKKKKRQCLKSDVSPTEEISQQYTKEILVEEQDEVSTLGGSVLAGMNFVEGAEDEPTASVNNDYDFVKQQYREQSFEDVRSRSQTSSSNPTIFSSESKLTGVIGKSLLADDASFEQQYQDSDRKEGFEVEVPPGKLGMVVDTPNGGIPEVRAIKNDSILFGSVVVGDQLLSVDYEDVTSMSAVEVSTLIARKAKQKRMLVFYRPYGRIEEE